MLLFANISKKKKRRGTLKRTQEKNINQKNQDLDHLKITRKGLIKAIKMAKKEDHLLNIQMKMEKKIADLKVKEIREMETKMKIKRRILIQ